MSNISQQLRMLRLAGVVAKRRDKKQILYSIADERIGGLIEFLRLRISRQTKLDDHEEHPDSRSRHGRHDDGEPPAQAGRPQRVEDHDRRQGCRPLLPAGVPVPALRDLLRGGRREAEAQVHRRGRRVPGSRRSTGSKRRPTRSILEGGETLRLRRPDRGHRHRARARRRPRG